jgi:hypothetical protein
LYFFFRVENYFFSHFEVEKASITNVKSMPLTNTIWPEAPAPKPVKDWLETLFALLDSKDISAPENAAALYTEDAVVYGMAGKAVGTAGLLSHPYFLLWVRKKGRILSDLQYFDQRLSRHEKIAGLIWTRANTKCYVSTLRRMISVIYYSSAN